MKFTDYYAVKAATNIIATNWNACRANVRKGMAALHTSQIPYKKFLKKSMAQDWLDGKKPIWAPLPVDEKDIVIYTGSAINKTYKDYGWAFTAVEPDGTEHPQYGRGETPELFAMGGKGVEMLSAMNAILWAKQNGYRFIEIRHVHKTTMLWTEGFWRLNNLDENSLPAKYDAWMKTVTTGMYVNFTHLPEKSNDSYWEYTLCNARQAGGLSRKEKSKWMEDQEKKWAEKKASGRV